MICGNCAVEGHLARDCTAPLHPHPVVRRHGGSEYSNSKKAGQQLVKLADRPDYQGGGPNRTIPRPSTAVVDTSLSISKPLTHLFISKRGQFLKKLQHCTHTHILVDTDCEGPRCRVTVSGETAASVSSVVATLAERIEDMERVAEEAKELKHKADEERKATALATQAKAAQQQAVEKNQERFCLETLSEAARDLLYTTSCTFSEFSEQVKTDLQSSEVRYTQRDVAALFKSVRHPSDQPSSLSPPTPPPLTFHEAEQGTEVEVKSLPPKSKNLATPMEKEEKVPKKSCKKKKTQKKTGASAGKKPAPLLHELGPFPSLPMSGTGDDSKWWGASPNLPASAVRQSQKTKPAPSEEPTEVQPVPVLLDRQGRALRCFNCEAPLEAEQVDKELTICLACAEHRRQNPIVADQGPAKMLVEQTAKDRVWEQRRAADRKAQEERKAATQLTKGERKVANRNKQLEAVASESRKAQKKK